MESIAVLILAAGKSSRMKSIKQLAKIHDKYLLEITLEKAQKLAPQKTYCVLGANAFAIQQRIDFKNTTIINNKNFEQGLSSSIISAINFFNTEQTLPNAVLILLADQPAIALSYLKKMVELHKKEPTKIIASQYNLKYGVPALIPSHYFKNLLKIRGDKGAKKFLNQHSDVVTSIKEKTNLIDIDTPEQLKLFINN